VPTREIQIPLFLWIAAAIIVHLLWGGSTQQAAVVVEEKAALRGFLARIQHEVQADLRPIPIAILDNGAATSPKPVEPEEETAAPDEIKEKSVDKKKVPLKEKTHREEEEKRKKPVEKPKPPEPHPPEEPKPENKPEEKKDLDLLAKKSEKKAPQELKVEQQKRIAVRQHVEDPNQADNPDAKFLGDKANRVKEETQAKITSTDQDHPNPTPGSSPNQQPGKEPGNADESRVASSFGDQDEGTSLPPPPLPPDTTTKSKPAATPPKGTEEKAQKEAQNSPKPSELPKAPKAGQAAQEEAPGTKPSPDIVAGSDGDHAMGGPAQSRPRRKRLPPAKVTKPSDWFGLGSDATTASGINLNLSHSDAVAVVGQEQLQADRRMDQLRRRSKRAGSWKSAGIERYRSAIENYVPSVRPGNTTALNTAAAPFASYLNDIHNRIHPIFAEDFLGSLNRLSASDPMNRPDLKTEVEIVLSKLDGSLVRRGLTRSSGILQFDVSALASIDRAAPFGPPPAAIVSPDGNVYLHWEFYRNPDFACSTYFAHPFMLKAAPNPTTPETAPAEPGPRALPGPRIMPTLWRPLDVVTSPSVQL
jgi:hypothetical protein